MNKRYDYTMKYLFIALIGFFAFTSLSAQIGTLNGRYGKNYLEKEILRNENANLQIVPDSPLSDGIIETITRSGNNWIVESLYQMELPADISPDDLSLVIYNSLSAISSLEGILYYSGEHEGMWPLIEEAWITSENRSNVKIEDPFFQELPESPRRTVFFQKDLKFGGNYYRADYYHESNCIRLSITNLSTLRYKAIPLMRPECLNNEILILWDDENLWFYGLTAFSMKNRLNLISERLMQNAFDYRLSALQGWLVDHIYTGADS